MNVVTDDESRIRFFEPHRKISNRVWLIKNATGTYIAKRIARVKKVMYAIFFTTKGLAIKVPVPKGSQ